MPFRKQVLLLLPLLPGNKQRPRHVSLRCQQQQGQQHVSHSRQQQGLACKPPCQRSQV
jgi:hypothetical protein